MTSFPHNGVRDQAQTNGILREKAICSSWGRMILDRRRFLTGGWPTSHAPKARQGQPVPCTIVVQLRPDRIDATLAAVAAREGVDVVDRNATGRVILALSGAAARDIAVTLAIMSDLPGVLSVMPASPIPVCERKVFA